MDLINNSVEQPSKGLYTDVAPVNQPPGTYRFALNAVNESDEGDFGTLTNEVSNADVVNLPYGFTCIGSVNITDNTIVLFLFNDKTKVSEIGLFNKDKEIYETWCNDSGTTETKNKLNFQINKPIQATFRIRRGCERVIYFVDGYNVPRSVNLDELLFYYDNGALLASKMDMNRKIYSVPKIKNIKIKDTDGNLKSGSIKICVKYVDKNKNETEVVSETEPIIIYEDSLKNTFEDIDGNLNLPDSKAYSSNGSTKSISFKIEDLDKNFEYYKLVFIHFENNTGFASAVYETQNISTEIDTYTYNGNGVFKSTLEELELKNKNQYIGSAKTITQKDNRLILGNIKGMTENWSVLQKYASKIGVDCVTKKVELNTLSDTNNPKNPLINIHGMEFMPGEVYSLGIVWIYEGNIESPAFHIPGTTRPNNICQELTEEEKKIYTILPMSDDNESENLRYTQASKCDNDFDYWGVDFFGNKLKDRKVRFHRLPKRTDCLYTKADENSSTDFPLLDTLVFNVYTSGKDSKFCEKNPSDVHCTTEKRAKEYSYRVTLNDGTVKEFTHSDDDVQKSFSIERTLRTPSDKLSAILDGVPASDAERYRDCIFVTRVEKRYQRASYTINNGIYSITYNIDNLETEDVILEVDETYYEDEEYEEEEEYVEDDGQGNKVKKKRNVKKTRKVEKTRKVNKNFGKRIKHNTYPNTNINTFVVSPTQTKVVFSEDYVYDLYTLNGGYRNIVSVYRGDFWYYDDNISFGITTTMEKISVQTKRLVTSNIYGLKFSNIEMPNLGNLKCIGYKIVKQERKEEDKTIIDKGYLLPLLKAEGYHCLSIINGNFKPEQAQKPDGFSEKFVALFTPRYKFQNDTLERFSSIINEGGVIPESNAESGFYIQNVNDYQTANVNDENVYTKQTDGSDLKVVIRSTELKCSNSVSNSEIKKEDLDFYNLQSCEYNVTENGETLMNLDMLNSQLILYNKKGNFDTSMFGDLFGDKKYPYVVLVKNHKNYYQDFLLRAYHDITDYENNSNITFKGDTFISAIRQTHLLHGNIAPKVPLINRSVWDYVKAAVVAVVGIAIAVFSVGTLAIVGGALIAAGGVFLGVKSEVKYQHLKDALNEFWIKGLKKVLYDVLFYSNNCNDEIYKDSEIGTMDDIIRHYGQVFGDLICESEVNMSLRVQNDNDKNNYLRPFSPFMYDRRDVITPTKSKDKDKNNHPGEFRHPWTITVYTEMSPKRGGGWRINADGGGVEIKQKEEWYFINKLTEVDKNRIKPKPDNNPNAMSGYKYRETLSTNEYVTNKDYHTNYHVLKYYALPQEYSFCSKCNEEFTNRFAWSEVSMEESLEDNYKVFKPNNYKDISSEYGRIVNIFVLANQLYIHVENGLWIQPTNYQERVTSGVVSYIGTGEFGSLPAQLRIDSKTGTSAGLTQRDSFVLTKYGYFFVCEREGKIYALEPNGQLKAISDIGMSKWFTEYVKSDIIRHFYLDDHVEITDEYELNNCPYLPAGVGYNLIFDEVNNRILVTKRYFYERESGKIESHDWTVSFSLKFNAWVSFHSYFPDKYFFILDTLYSIKNGKIYRHQSIEEGYNKFYDRIQPFIVEFVSNNSPMTTKVYNHIRYISNAYRYDTRTKSFVEKRYLTFNKALLSNSRQCSGLMNLKVKDITDPALNYMQEQVINTNNGTILLDRNERDWLLNDLRDYVINYAKPLFIKRYYKTDVEEPTFDVQDLNESVIDINKDWYNLESFRDKFLVIRLIFDTFAEENKYTKLVLNISNEHSNISQY